MAWLVLAGLVLFVVLRLATRRRAQLELGPSESISTVYFAASRRQPAKVRSALAAATAVLR